MEAWLIWCKSVGAWSRALLLVEAVICFGPITYLWFAGFAALPFSLIAFFSDGDIEQLLFPLLTLLGGLGLLGAISLFLSIDQVSLVVGTRKIVFQLCCGVTACLILVSLFGRSGEAVGLLFSAPVFATLHFFYLCRRHFFPVKGVAS